MNKEAKNLEIGTKLNNGRYTIQAILSPGVNCLTYLANEGSSIIKEFCPEGATRNEDGSLSGCEDTSEFKKLANMHRYITNGAIGVNSLGTYDLFEENNTMYFVYDFSGSDTRADFISYGYTHDYGKADFQNSYDRYIKTNRDKLTLYDVIYPVWLAAHALYEYHEKGYVHMNLKPSKLLVSTDENNRPVAVQILETGSMVREENHKALIITRGWSDVGVVLGLEDDIDGRCDIYSLGMILFGSAVKSIEDDEVEYVTTFHREFPFEEGKCTCIVSADEMIKNKLANVFEHSMTCYRGSRYDTALQFADALAEIIMDLPETDQEAFTQEKNGMQEWHNRT